MAKKRRVHKRKNPVRAVAKLKGKTHKSKTVLTPREKKVIQKRIASTISKYKGLSISQRPAGMLQTVQSIKNILKKDDANRKEVSEFMKKFVDLGAKVKVHEVGPSKGGKVAKKKRKKKKSSHKKAKASRKKHARRKKKSSHKKVSHKKKHVAKKHKAKKHVSKKRRSKKRHAKKASYQKGKVVVSHKFGSRRDKVTAKIPKLKKGKSVKKSYKRKKRRFTVMVKRSNPIFGSPRAALNKVDKHFQTATGHDLKEAGLLFGAGAALPVIEGLVMKVPGMDMVKSKVGSFGPEAAAMSSSLVTILGLGALHYAMEKVPALSKAKMAEPAVRALIAASVVKAGSALSGVVARATGLSGVLYTPLSGINFTPMSGVNFTPNMSGQPQMGIYPQLNGAPQMGYGADFGRGFDVSDYGGGSGYTEDRKLSPSDFGGCEDDADYGDEEPVLDQSGGSL